MATKMADKNLLLLEAGNGFTLVPKLPILGPIWQGSTEDWKYVTEPQAHGCKAMNNQQSKWPRGKVFGGSHLLSNLIQMVGDPDDYRGYVDPHLPFDYETDIGQYFREYEAIMNIEPTKFQSDFSRLLKLAGSEIGLYEFHQPNVSMRNGLRFTTASLYRGYTETAPDGDDRNHTLLFNAMVDRLHLGQSSGRHVDTVEFSKGGVTYMARARKAIILSAGAIGSPAILLRSGIGPKADLEDLQIDPRVDLPVGHNLVDHVATGIDLVSVDTSTGTGVLDILSVKNLYEYLWQNGGLMSMPGCDLVTRLKVLNSSTSYDLEFMVIPVALNSDHGLHLRKILNIRDDVYYDYFHSNAAGNASDSRQSVTILPVVLKPKSVGVLRLRSSNADDPPIIDPRYLSHPLDRQVLIAGIQLIKRLVETTALQGVGAQIRQTVFPGCEAHPFDSENYWMCYIEHVTLTSYHPAGTCKMGSCPEDSVVDFNFKVHGVDNLYVIDASVMPELPAANPIATINMLALRFLDRVMSKL